MSRLLVTIFMLFGIASSINAQQRQAINSGYNPYAFANIPQSPNAYANQQNSGQQYQGQQVPQYNPYAQAQAQYGGSPQAPTPPTPPTAPNSFNIPQIPQIPGFGGNAGAGFPQAPTAPQAPSFPGFGASAGANPFGGLGANPSPPSAGGTSFLPSNNRSQLGDKQIRTYVRASFGLLSLSDAKVETDFISSQEVSFDAGTAIAVAYGVDEGKFGGEVEFVSKANGAGDSGLKDVKLLSLNFNALYYVPIVNGIRAYGTGGIGLAGNNSNGGFSDITVGYKAEAGGILDLEEYTGLPFDVYGGYEYYGILGDITLSSTGVTQRESTNYKTSGLNFGLRYKF